MEQQLDELKAYQESEAFRKDVIDHVAAHPQEAAEILCLDEAVVRRVI